MLDTLATHKSVCSKIRLPTVLCVLLKLNYPLKMVIVTNIIDFYSWLVHFQNVFELRNSTARF